MNYNDLVTLIKTVANAANPTGSFFHGRNYDTTLEFDEVYPQIHLYPFSQSLLSGNENIVRSTLLVGFWKPDGHDKSMTERQNIINDMMELSVLFESGLRQQQVFIESIRREPQYLVQMGVVSGVAMEIVLQTSVGCDTPLIVCQPVVLTLNNAPFLTLKSGTNEDIELLDEDGNPVTPVSVVGAVITVPNSGGGGDAEAVLKDSAGNVISITSIPAGDTEDIPAPDATLTVNSAAFGSPRSNQSVDILLRDQNGAVITPTSLVYPQINISRYDEVDLYMSRIGSTNALWFDYLRAFKWGCIADGIWDKAICINPVMGGSASAHAFTLVGSPFLFFGGITHDANGMQGNGTNGYYSTQIGLQVLPQNNHSLFIYIRNNVAENVNDIGAIDSTLLNGITLISRNASNILGTRSYTATNNLNANNDSRGVFGLSRLNSSQFIQQANATQNTIIATSAATSYNGNIFGFTTNFNNTASSFATRQQSFVWLGYGLTSVQMNNLRNRIITLQTSLGRNV